MLSILFKSHLIRHSGTGQAFKDTQRALEHWRHSESTQALGHSESTQGALGHLESTRGFGGHLGTWRALGHSDTWGTWALRHLGHSGTSALKALGHPSNLALEALYLSDSFSLWMLCSDFLWSKSLWYKVGIFFNKNSSLKPTSDRSNVSCICFWHV